MTIRGQMAEHALAAVGGIGHGVKALAAVRLTELIQQLDGQLRPTSITPPVLGG
jgi:hypothetical protein